MALKYSSSRVLSVKSCIPSGHLDILMAHELLEDLQTHAGIEKLRCIGVPQRVNGVAFVRKACFVEVLYEARPCSAVTDRASPLLQKTNVFSGSLHVNQRFREKTASLREIDHSAAYRFSLPGRDGLFSL